MKRILLAFASLFLLLPFTPVEGLAQKKKEGKGGKGFPKAEPAEYVKIQNQKELVGQLGFADERAVSIRLEFQHLQPNPAFKPGGIGGAKGGTNLNRLYQEIQRDYAEIARARNPVERQRRMQELQRDMQRLQMEIARAKAKGVGGGKAGGGNSPFKTVTEKKEFDLNAADKLIVRRANPPFEYDDKGEIKKFSKEELEKMRGNDPKLPGYQAKLEDLLAGQTVKLVLVPPAKKKDKDKEDEEVVFANRPSVTMIIIMEEPSISFMPKGKK